MQSVSSTILGPSSQAKGYAYHPRTQSACPQGFTVRPIQPYPLPTLRMYREPMPSLITPTKTILHRGLWIPYTSCPPGKG